MGKTEKQTTTNKKTPKTTHLHKICWENTDKHKNKPKSTNKPTQTQTTHIPIQTIPNKAPAQPTNPRFHRSTNKQPNKKET